MSDGKIKVLVLRDFKDGYDEFTKDESRFLEPERAQKFQKYGWVSIDGESGTPYVGEHDLNIHNSILGQRAPKIGA